MTNFKDITIRQQLSSRGGGIEIDCTSLGFPNVRMTAYQNYLGGGMLGRVCGDCNASDWREYDELVRLNEELKQYFHGLTNPDEDEWEHQTYEQNQNLPTSAY